MNTMYNLPYSTDERYEKTAQSLDNAFNQICSADEFVNRMYDTFVKEFHKNAAINNEKNWFFGMMVAMGYHTVDFVKMKKGHSIDFCPNYAYLLSNFDNNKLPKDSYFQHKDYAHSDNYSNNVFEWLDELGVQHLKALVSGLLIKP